MNTGKIIWIAALIAVLSVLPGAARAGSLGSDILSMFPKDSGELAYAAGVTPQTASSHLARLVDAGLTKAQWKAVSPFFVAHDDLLRHAANSPAVTRRYGFSADMIRAGLALYGGFCAGAHWL